MAAIDFPDSPTIGDNFTAGNSSYRWTGTSWISNILGQVTWTDVTGKPAEVETSAAIETFVDGRVQLIVAAAPAALDTLNELAASLNDDADFAGTMTTALSGKAATVHTHVKSDITDFAHVHPISEVTSLQDALDAKKSEAIYEIAANNTLLANSRYFVNTTAARTLTLPSSPAVGAEIWVIDQSNQAETYNITVNNGGSLINGVSDTLVVDVNGAIAKLVYTGSTLGWRI
jgi:hypothetical protein